MRIILAAAAMVLSGPALAANDRAPVPQIVVEAEGRIEQTADYFTAGTALEARNKDRLMALSAISEQLDQLRDGLARLDGLERFRLEASAARAEAILPRGCDSDRYGDAAYPGNCAPVDFVASIDLSLEGWPATVAGTAVSYLTEIGSRNARLGEYALDDPAAAKRRANAEALRNALDAAREIAAAADVEISGPPEIAFAERRLARARAKDVESIIVAGSPISPQVSLDLPPETVVVTSTVTIAVPISQTP